MINKDPTIYKIPNIYAKSGGGGGYVPIPDNIEIYLKLKETVNARFNQAYLNNFPLLDNDIVNFIGEINLTQTSAGVFAGILCINSNPLTGINQDKNVICLSYSGTNNRFRFEKSGYVDVYPDNVDNSFKILSIKLSQKKLKIAFNGQNFELTRNIEYSGNLAFTQFWPRTDGGWQNTALFYLYSIQVKNENDLIKYEFVPAYDTNTSKIGLFEKITGTFISGNSNSNFELIGKI